MTKQDSEQLDEFNIETKSSSEFKVVLLIIALSILDFIITISYYYYNIKIGDSKYPLAIQNEALLESVLIASVLPILSLILFGAKKKFGWTLVIILNINNILFGLLTFLQVFFSENKIESYQPVFLIYNLLLVALPTVILYFTNKAILLTYFNIEKRRKILSFIIGIVYFFFMVFVFRFIATYIVNSFAT